MSATMPGRIPWAVDLTDIRRDLNEIRIQELHCLRRTTYYIYDVASLDTSSYSESVFMVLVFDK